VYQHVFLKIQIIDYEVMQTVIHTLLCIECNNKTVEVVEKDTKEVWCYMFLLMTYSTYPISTRRRSK